jgi:hypothetical protein
MTLAVSLDLNALDAGACADPAPALAKNQEKTDACSESADRGAAR